ncbi:chitin synthase chs-1 [Gadus morhua]|uniref:chitin synthase chs-1 n=1 Tax=Gadus morhua TaxID=8049 RepID=UPI0011B80E25|nr:chitin synthase chs-1-like [Gadus morhua]
MFVCACVCVRVRVCVRSWKPWDTFKERPEIHDGATPWKYIKILSFLLCCLCGLVVFALALCSKASFLLLITVAGPTGHSVPPENKALVLLAIWGTLVAPSLLLMIKNIWKAVFFGSKLPSEHTVVLVVSMEFLVSGGAAVLALAAMPHLDIVTNMTILNSVAVFSSLFQVASRSHARLCNSWIVAPVFSVLLILAGHTLFLALYLMDAEGRREAALRCGLAVGATVLVSLTWWQNYLPHLLLPRHAWLTEEMQRCAVVVHLLTSFTRLAVTACVLAAYVPLSGGAWSSVWAPVAPAVGRLLATLAGLQLLSSVVGHWLSLAACKMNALRRCFLLPLYLASLALLPLFLAPVFIYFQLQQDAEGPGYGFARYCEEAVHAGRHTLGDGGFQRLVLDATTQLCALGVERPRQTGLLTCAAVCWWVGFLLATAHTWALRLQRIQTTKQLFVRRMYEGAWLEQGLLLNARFNMRPPLRRTPVPEEKLTLYMCATMWHETFSEMEKIIISIFRWDQFRPHDDREVNNLTTEAHIFFDDAFRTVPVSGERHANQYVEDMVQVIQKVYSLFQEDEQSPFMGPGPIGDQILLRTPYGGRLNVTLPCGNLLVVHLKDKSLIRHKKRWSQIMYMYYLLGWRLDTRFYRRWLNGEDQAQIEREKERERKNTYILALDGDTDFHPPAVMLLIDRLKQYPDVGAACGRIHPTGTGPIVWYQKFEYALTHWLYKTAEHVLGCVLCSPGCFSLFRGAALMDVNIMKRYTTPPTEALHHIQYDQGEDRWLCTLMLQQGWRVEYNAASDAYTNAPEGFKEFYNQRRRWTPSTLANSIDLLGGSIRLARKNRSISRPYLLYEMFIVGSSILIPATVCLMVTGMLSLLLAIDPNWALILATIPPAIYLGLCFYLKADTQVTLAAVLSVLYALIMMVTMLTVISFLVTDDTIFSPLAISFVTFVMVYVVAALLHPQEAHLIVYGLLYILAIPSAYLLLSIYSIVNMNNVSWGTREGAATAGAAVPPPPRNKMESARDTMRQLYQQARCCRCSCLRECSGYTQVGQCDSDLPVIAATGGEPMTTMVEPGPQNTVVGAGPQNTIVGAGPQNTVVGAGPQNTVVGAGPQNTIVERQPEISSVGVQTSPQSSLRRRGSPLSPVRRQDWIDRLRVLSGVRVSFLEDSLEEHETQFWNDLTERYLKPFPDDEDKKRETIKSLRELRNMATFIYFFANLLWLVATFTLQLLKGALSIRIPKYDNSLTFTGDYILVEPVTFMFLFTFVLLVVLQFLTMLFHRTYTLIHFIGYVNTEMKKGHIQSSDRFENSWSPEAWVNEDELYSVSQAGGTMV